MPIPFMWKFLVMRGMLLEDVRDRTRRLEQTDLGGDARLIEAGLAAISHLHPADVSGGPRGRVRADESAQQAVERRRHRPAGEMAEHETLEDARSDIDRRMPAAGAIGIDEPLPADPTEGPFDAVGVVVPLFAGRVSSATSQLTPTAKFGPRPKLRRAMPRQSGATRRSACGSR